MKGQTYLASSRPSSRPPGSGELVDVEAMSTTTLVLDVQGVEAAPERKTSDCFDQSTHENAENSEEARRSDVLLCLTLQGNRECTCIMIGM
ncbi:hypothetical protein MTO96_040905 [Rhipicephalus appendiculatus]